MANGGDALAEGLEAAHLCLGAAACVVSGPPLPECPAMLACGAEGFNARLGGWAILLPWSAVFRIGMIAAAAREDGAVAAAG
jgi:hypothetical protein